MKNVFVKFAAVATMGLFLGNLALAGDPKEKFDMIDKDKSTKITTEEYSAHMEEMFNKADGDKDGMLKKGELVGFMMDEKGKSAGKAGRKADKKMDMMDADGDGTLTMEEMRAGAQAKVKAWDTKTKDGQVDMDEFKAGWNQKM